MSTISKRSYRLRKFILLVLCFILFSIIGTLSHEMGHIAVAEALGYETSLHYGSMNYDNSELTAQLDSIYLENRQAVENGLDFEQKALYDEKMEELYNHSFLVLVGGPLQTILTGITGLVILIFRRESIRKKGMKIFDWVALFLSLFWLREVFNFFHSLGSGMLYSEKAFFGGDERYISEALQWHPGIVPLIMALIGLIISVWVIFRVLPRNYRLMFIISGFIGGIGVYLIWFEIAGPLLLP